uniref:Uncharacterized protein n=1 Tax=Setaria italica TaxID=4555 RepID=K3XNV5_SETIT
MRQPIGIGECSLFSVPPISFLNSWRFNGPSCRPRARSGTDDKRDTANSKHILYNTHIHYTMLQYTTAYVYILLSCMNEATHD